MLEVVGPVLAVVCKRMQQLKATLEVVAFLLAVVSKRTQQLKTMLGQQCWKLLRSCWQWCTNGCNNSQQCWNLQCTVGRIQPIRLPVSKETMFNARAWPQQA